MTIKQKHCLLAYLGYYTGDVNANWGQSSKDATRAFQEDFCGIAVDGDFGPETEKAAKHAISYGFLKKEEKKDFWDSIKYFERSEFKCKCGKCGGFPVEPSEELAKVLDKIRTYFGKPVYINSGVRCATHNKNVGGATSSQHLKGTAADISVEGVAPSRVATYAETLLPKTGGIGRYSTFTHVDVRQVKSRWNG